MITLYLTWSPWHYTAQNYGVALMLLERRGAAPSTLASRLLHASFVISFVLAIVLLHGQKTPLYTPDGISGYEFRVVTLGTPAAIRDAAIALGSVAWLACWAAWTAPGLDPASDEALELLAAIRSAP